MDITATKSLRNRKIRITRQVQLFSLDDEGIVTLKRGMQGTIVGISRRLNIITVDFDGTVLQCQYPSDVHGEPYYEIIKEE